LAACPYGSAGKRRVKTKAPVSGTFGSPDARRARKSLAGRGSNASGAMDKGLTFASDMMSNLVSGAKDTASDNLQKTTTGGRMAANIDADNAANLLFETPLVPIPNSTNKCRHKGLTASLFPSPILWKVMISSLFHRKSIDRHAL
jgi:hypothetical protein